MNNRAPICRLVSPWAIRSATSRSPPGQRQPAPGGRFWITVGLRPERGGELIAAAKNAARVTGCLQRRAEFAAGLGFQGVQAGLDVGEGLSAGALTYGLDDAEQHGCPRPVAERCAGSGEQARAPQHSPPFRKRLKDGQGLAQQRANASAALPSRARQSAKTSAA